MTLPVPESYTAIERPVALDVIKQLIAFMNLKDHDLTISYRGISEMSQLANGTLTPIKNSADTAFFRQHGKLSAVVTENYDENSYLTMSIHYPDALLVFKDDSLRTHMKPVYSQTEVSIEFTYRAQSRQQATAWRDNVRNRIYQGSTVLSHEVQYEYAIPKEELLILGEIHRLRENVAGYGEDFGKWFNDHVSDKLTVLTKMSGDQPHLVFKEKQLNVVGFFDFSEPPTASKGDVGALWEINFTYKFRYEKPTHMVLYYPIAVHNQMIPSQLRGAGVETSYHRMIGDMSLSNQRYDYFRKMNNHYYEQFEGVRIPYFDEWYPHTLPYTQSSLLLMLCQVDPNDPTLVIDLNQLGDYTLKAELKTYFSKYHTKLTQGKTNPFMISLYKHEFAHVPTDFYIDENLVIRTNNPMDLRSVYHLHIGLMSDLSMLTEQARDELLNEPDMCLSILRALGPDLEERGLLPKPVGNRLIPKHQFRTALSNIRTTSPAAKGGRGYANVGLFVVNTHQWS